MAGFASSQDEPNTALWLAAQASKMERYCPLGIELELGQYPAILTSRLVHMNIYLTIIPWARVGYEMVNSQRGA